MTPSKLSEHFKEKVPNTKIGSKSYWGRFLEYHNQQEEVEKRRITPFKTLINSLDLIISSLEAQGRDASAYIRKRVEILALPEFIEDDLVDYPVAHPDVSHIVELCGKEDDGLLVHLLNGLVQNTQSKKVEKTVKTEAAKYLAALGQKNRRMELNARPVIEMFVSVCGHLQIKEVKVDNYKQFLDKVKKQVSWNDTTKAKNQGRIHTMLRIWEAEDDGVRYPFLGKRHLMLEVPDGKKVQFSLEQLKLALSNAEGVLRTSVLLAINCGFTHADIAELNESHINEDYLCKKRAKLKRKKVQPKWWLWPETKKAIQFGISRYKLDYHFQRFQKAYDLPYHKAIRCGVAQILHDQYCEDVARLYRGESVGGSHGKNYIRSYSDAQVTKLRAGLEFLRNLIVT
jgi:hypothetical protein